MVGKGDKSRKICTNCRCRKHHPSPAATRASTPVYQESVSPNIRRLVSMYTTPGRRRVERFRPSSLLYTIFEEEEDQCVAEQPTTSKESFEGDNDTKDDNCKCSQEERKP